MRLLSAGLFAFAAGSLFADVRLPSVISDHMVLQRGAASRLWGWADPDEKVTIAFRTYKASAIAGKDGKWQSYLPPMDVAAPGDLTIEGHNRIGCTTSWWAKSGSLRDNRIWR